MNDFDNDELVAAFENIVTIYHDRIGPYAVDIVRHLTNQYMRLINRERKAQNEDDESEALLTAVASYTSMRRILDVVQDDVELLTQIEGLMYPCLVHSLTEAGFDSLEEGIDCITMFVHNNYRDKPIAPRMWVLYP